MVALEDMVTIDGVAIYLYLVKQMISGLAFAMAVSGLDDVIIDALYQLRLSWRQLAVYSRFPRASARDLPARSERPMAILLPAWREADVIEAMLRTSLARLDYAAFVIFVGVYPNDPDTAAIVDRLAAEEPRILRASVPHPGGTSKGDCLNAIWREIRLHELETGTAFQGFILHDAEDLVHPRELSVFNHLIGRKDMVQLPVVPLPQTSSPWVAGHYLDEFAELHGKDLLVREWLGATVPCAGVACGFSRPAMLAAARSRGGRLFADDSLTEDYELAHRLRRMGFSSAFVRIPESSHSQAAVATSEYFPDAFAGAVRQKSRWLAGITLQGWESLGWRGSFAERYMLLRDRKAIVTACLNMLAYVAAAHMLVLWLLAEFAPDAPHFAPLVTPGSTTEQLLILNAALLVWRLAMRAGFTGRQYGWLQGMLAVPRAVVGNVINFAAAVRAITLYVRARVSRQRMAWDKTDHRYPVALAEGTPA